MNKGISLQSFRVQGWLRLSPDEAVNMWLATGKPLHTVRHGTFDPKRFSSPEDAHMALKRASAPLSQVVNMYRLPMSSRAVRLLATDGMSAAKQYARSLGVRDSDWLDKGTGLVVIQVEDAS